MLHENYFETELVLWLWGSKKAIHFTAQLLVDSTAFQISWEIPLQKIVLVLSDMAEHIVYPITTTELKLLQ